MQPISRHRAIIVNRPPMAGITAAQLCRRALGYAKIPSGRRILLADRHCG